MKCLIIYTLAIHFDHTKFEFWRANLLKRSRAVVILYEEGVAVRILCIVSNKKSEFEFLCWREWRPDRGSAQSTFLFEEIISKFYHWPFQTNKYMLAHQLQDAQGEIMTQFIKGDIKVSRGGGRVVEFTDVEIASKNPCSKAAFTEFNKQVYPPPVMESGDWTDTETRVSYKCWNSRS